MLVSKPPKGGTLAAVGVPSPRACANLPPLEFRVYAEPRPNPKALSRLSRSFAVETTWAADPGWYESGLRPLSIRADQQW
ncbi:MAG: hypothetical protein GX456_00005 [Verrucomicrobia bacterium]|nr:hypothetical protein [Verrucomicrobiota bacterium]